MNKGVKIGLAAAAVLASLLLALALRQQDQKVPGNENSVESIGEIIGDKTHQTKLKAYDAYANEKEEFYKRPFNSRPQGTPSEQPATDEVLATDVTEQPTHHSAKDKQFEEAYKEAEQNVRVIYNNAGVGEVELPQSHTHPSKQLAAPEESSEERRRRAMQQDWGVMSPEAVEVGAQDVTASMFRAVIHGTQLVKSGQVALFRTKEEISYGGVVIPANTLLSGFASVNSNRLIIKISSVRLNQEIFALPLEIYGSDGIAGIPLNYNEAGQIVDAQASSTVVQEASSAMSGYGGTVGRVAGALVSGIGGQVRNAKNVEVKLIDNQMVILKIAKQ